MSSSQESDQEYEVEQVLEKKKFGSIWKYKVKWLGYSLEECTWEPKENLINVDDLLDDFEKEWLSKNKPSNKSSNTVKKSKKGESENEFIQTIELDDKDGDLLKKKRKNEEKNPIPGKNTNSNEKCDEFKDIPMCESKISEEEKTEEKETNCEEKSNSKDRKRGRPKKNEKEMLPKNQSKQVKHIKSLSNPSSNTPNIPIIITEDELNLTEGSLKNGDKIKRVITAKQGPSSEVLCLVEWHPRTNGTRPSDSFVQNLLVREHAGNLLLDFYESRLRFPSSQN